MKTKRLHVAESFGIWCISAVLVATLGLAECGATEPVLGGSKTTATGAAGGATSEGASSQLGLLPFSQSSSYSYSAVSPPAPRRGRIFAPCADVHH